MGTGFRSFFKTKIKYEIFSLQFTESYRQWKVKNRIFFYLSSDLIIIDEDHVVLLVDIFFGIVHGHIYRLRYGNYDYSELGSNSTWFLLVNYLQLPIGL